MFAMNIKKAVTSDLPRLIDFDQIAQVGHGRIEEIKTAIVRGACWVFSDAGVAHGYAILQNDFYNYPLVRLIYVSEAHRRKGVASRLIRHLETVSGANRMFVSSAENNVAMAALMARLGYQQCGEIHGIDDKAAEFFFMKRLG